MIISLSRNEIFINNIDSAATQQQLQKQRPLEAVTGKCNFGPHRDDIEFLINNISIRKYGSSGQQRTFILALKMDLVYRKLLGLLE